MLCESESIKVSTRTADEIRPGVRECFKYLMMFAFKMPTGDASPLLTAASYTS